MIFVLQVTTPTKCPMTSGQSVVSGASPTFVILVKGTALIILAEVGTVVQSLSMDGVIQQQLFPALVVQKLHLSP